MSILPFFMRVSCFIAGNEELFSPAMVLKWPDTLWRGIMAAVKGFWQHTNGTIYAVKSDSFGNIIGGAGPLDPDNLYELDEYDYKSAIVDWLEEAFAQYKLHRINPQPCNR